MSVKMCVPIPDEGIEYDQFGRLLYHPEFHTNQGQPFTTEDLVYLCKFYEVDGYKSVSLALGRTEKSVKQKVENLKKYNQFDYYKNKWDLLFNRYYHGQNH